MHTFDYTKDAVAYLYTLSDDALRDRAKVFGLTSYDMLNKEYIVRTISILSLRKRFEKYEKGQQNFHENIRDCAQARITHYESCKDKQGWKENGDHEFARELLTTSDKDCDTRLNEVREYMKSENSMYESWLKNHQKELLPITDSDSRSSSPQTNSSSYEITTRDFFAEAQKEARIKNDRRRDEERKSLNEKELVYKQIENEEKRDEQLKKLRKISSGDAYFYRVRNGLISLDDGKLENRRTMTSFNWIEQFKNMMIITQKKEVDDFLMDQLLFEVYMFDPPINLIVYGNFGYECLDQFYDILISHGSVYNMALWVSFLEPFIFYQNPDVNAAMTTMKTKNAFGKTGYQYITTDKALWYFGVFFDVYAKKSFAAKTTSLNTTIFNTFCSLLDISNYETFLKDTSTTYNNTKLSHEDDKILSKLVSSTRNFVESKVMMTTAMFEAWQQKYGAHVQVCQDVLRAYHHLNNVIYKSKNKEFQFSQKKGVLKIKLPDLNNSKDEVKLKRMAVWYEKNCL